MTPSSNQIFAPPYTLPLATNRVAPSPPQVIPIYRGFYILPGDDLPSYVKAVSFYVSRSDNGGATWSNLSLLETVSLSGDADDPAPPPFVTSHKGLDDNIQYHYRCIYEFIDGSKTALGAIGYAGNPQFIAIPDLNIDPKGTQQYKTSDRVLHNPNTASSHFTQTVTDHELVIDDNDGAFYILRFNALGPGATQAFTFRTARPLWASALTVGSITGGAYLLWIYSWGGANLWNVTVLNPLTFTQGAGAWIGYVIGY